MILGIIIGLFIGGCVGVVVMAITQMAKDDEDDEVVHSLSFGNKIELQKLYYRWLDEESKEYKTQFPNSTAHIEDNAFNVFSYLDSYNLLDIEKAEEFLIEQKGGNDDE